MSHHIQKAGKPVVFLTGWHLALNKIRSPGLEVAAKRLFKTSVVALASVCHGWAVEHPAA